MTRAEAVAHGESVAARFDHGDVTTAAEWLRKRAQVYITAASYSRRVDMSAVDAAFLHSIADDLNECADALEART